jgi:hypothetical protein
MKKRYLISILLTLLMAACGVLTTSGPAATFTPLTVEPNEGQPDFPPLGQYWVVDRGCNFDDDKIRIVDEVFEKLRMDGIAEVALICQTGIQDKGATNDQKIWLRDWGRWAKMGDVEDDRSLIWLIQPDVPPEAGRVTLEVSRWLTWYTAVDYYETLQEAANYANANDFNGALISIARNVDAQLRHLWETHSAEGG